jgi:hypothetical protein
MKVKYLVHKETREFIEVTTMCGTPMVFTSELPHMPMNADKSNDEILEYLKTENPTINFDDYEVVEFDLVQSDVIGADIRNKLSPPNNLLAMLEDYFSIANEDTKEKILVYIRKEMKQTEISIEYLKNLL